MRSGFEDEGLAWAGFRDMDDRKKFSSKKDPSWELFVPTFLTIVLTVKAHYTKARSAG